MLRTGMFISQLLLWLTQMQVALSSPPLVWAISGGGTRAYTSTLGYISLFHQLDLISHTESKFTSISANSGGAFGILPAFFSPNFLEQTLVDADTVTTLVRDYLDQIIPPIDVNDPRCDPYATIASANEVFYSVCNRLSPYENFDFASYLKESIQMEFAPFFDDVNFPNRTVTYENINPPFLETDLLIEVGFTPTGLLVGNAEDDRMIVALSPNSDNDENLNDVVYSTPIVSYYVINKKKNSWMYAVDEKELPFQTQVYSIPNNYDENDWSDYPLTPDSASSALTTTLRFQKVVNSTSKFREPFEGKHPTISQVLAPTMAAWGVFSPFSPAVFSMTAAFFRSTLIASSPPDLLQLLLFFFQNVVNYTYESLTLGATTVCTQWPQTCGMRDARLMDAGLLELLSLSGAVANYQANHHDADDGGVVKAIVTHHNLGYITYIDFLSYFETTWNDGIAPGDYYWPNGNNETGGILPYPQRSYQIFEDYIDQDLLDQMTHEVVGDTNMTTTIIEATTLDNPAFGIQAGLKVHILYIMTNANTPRDEQTPLPNEEYTQLANTIASNPDLAQVIRDFVSEDVEIPPPTVTPTKKPTTTTKPTGSPTYYQKKSKKSGLAKKNMKKQKTHK